MAKFLKRFSFFLIVAFVLLNTVTFLVLNSPIIQHAVVNYININFLKKQNLLLNLDSLSLSFFSAAINLNEVSIREIEPRSSNNRNFNFSLNQISIGLDIPSSYLKQKPIPKKVLLRGMQVNLNYDNKGKIILPDFLKSDDDSNIDLPKIFGKLFPNLPNEFDILNAIIIIGKETDKNYQNINVNKLELNKILTDKNHGLDIKAYLSGTFLKFPFFQSDIKVKQLELIGTLWQNGITHVKILNLDSNILNLNSSFSAFIANKIEESNYEIDINLLQIFGKDFFSLFKLKSDGFVNLVGNLKSGKTLESVPTFVGKASWDKLTLQNFLLYNGNALINFKDKIVTYKQAEIISPHKGKITSEGKFELFGNFDFVNQLTFDDFSFADLLNALDVKFSPVDFVMKSTDIRIVGSIFSKNIRDSFEIFANGKAQGRSLLVTTFEQNGRKPLPNFDLNLALQANKHEILFDKSFITLSSVFNQGKMLVPHGKIDLAAKNGTNVVVNLVGENINIGDAEYFLKLPTAGIANFNSTIKVIAPSSEVLFQAKTSLSKGVLLGIDFNKMVGEWGLDSKGVWAKNMQVDLGKNYDKISNFLIEKLRFNFADSKANIIAAGHGNLNGLTSSLHYWIPEIMENAEGEIKDLSVHLDGLLFHPSNWNLQATSIIKNFKIMNGGAKNFNLLLSCKAGECEHSHVKINSIYANASNKNDKESTLPPTLISQGSSTNLLKKPEDGLQEVAEQPNSIPNGQVLIQIDDLSFIKSAFRIKIYQFPLQIFEKDNSQKIEGSLDSNALISGSWDNLEGVILSKISGLRINSLNYGDILLNMKNLSKQGIQFDLSAFSSQIKSKLLISENINQDSHLDIQFNKFNITQLLSDEIRAKNNLFSQFTGNFKFHGPLTKDFFKNPINSIYKWSGKGNFTDGVAQFQKVVLNIDEQNDFLLSKNQVIIPELILKSDLINIHTNGSVDLSKKMLSLLFNFNMDLSYLKNAFTDIFDDPSNGSAHAKISLAGKWDELKLNGSMNFSGSSISLKNYPPNLTNLEGLINFKGQTIEIEKITAHKGKGDISVAGNIDFSKGVSPEFNLRANANKADFRLQIPIFLFLDINLDSNIAITGRGEPYLINGEVNILKLQMLRDLSCAQISSQVIALPKKDHTIINDAFANLDIDVRAMSSINIQSQCLRAKLSTEPFITITGDTSSPSLNGTIAAESANLQVLKTSFDVKKAQLQFVDVQKYDPNVDIQMQGKVNSYNIYWKVNGRLSQARLDLSADPPLLPNGDRIVEADIISMISTGQVPSQSSNANLLSASSGVASFLGINNFFESTLNNTVNSVTGGLVENISVVPTTQNGQLSWRADASRSISQRLNLGVSYQDGTAGSSKSAYANYLFNDTVSAIGSFTSSNLVQQEQQTPPELFSGLRFQFGSQ